MKRTVILIALTAVLLTALLPLSLSVHTVSAQNAYTIQRVDHQVHVMYSGHIVISDTIHITGSLSNGFLIGFPYQYGVNVLKAVTYDQNHNVYPMSLGVPLENRVGYYGAKIDFGQSNPQVFTVVFVLSNKLLTQTSSGGASTVTFNLDYPAYPSFVQDAGTCNVSIVLPETPTFISITKNDGSVETTTNYIKNNLPAFTYSPATATFTVHFGNLQLLTIEQLDRQVTLGPAGELASTDTYRFKNNSPDSISSLKLWLPIQASNIVARDEFGRTLTTSTLATSGTMVTMNVTLVSSLAGSGPSTVSVSYNLPSATSSQGTRFSIDFVLFPAFDYYVEKATVTFVPPEGARFVTPNLSELGTSLSLTREIFQETLSMKREGVSYVDYDVSSADVLQITYDYNVLWLSFRPTMWIWLLAIVGVVVVAVWRRPRRKAAAPARIVTPKVSVGLTPDDVRSFTEAYAEKNRIASELKSLDTRAQKGRIPRRQYKVQRRTLELRSEALSKNISGLKVTFRSAGGVYADLVRQLDFAETELVEVETNIRTIETRQNRGELSLEEYKKMMADYQRRKEKAETTINGILLRLREELH
ncbi:MAG: hypothetical protein NWE99_02515 [Candidatus Bathyarchaeota archaeon]|nr:hypothetical protein [Candidatus Bathyarchaeota archaeon]